MNRVLYSVNKSCSLNCAYCFANWQEYQRQCNFADMVDTGCKVIYPGCDGEILRNQSVRSKLIELSSARASDTIISISTKSLVDDSIVNDLVRINDVLTTAGKGFLKVSVSITTISRIADIESGAASFEERLRLLEKLVDVGISTSVNIKPVLPFISLIEYKELIDRSREYTPYFLLGDLYVSTQTTFFQRLINGKYPVSERRVSWLDSHPVWKFVDLPEHKAVIREAINSSQGVAFDCDLDVLSELNKTVLAEPVIVSV